MSEKIELFEEKLLLKNLSDKTISSYIGVIKVVALRLNKHYDDIDETDLRKYIVSRKRRNISSSSQMSIINSFKAYYREVKGRKFDHDILPRPKIEQKQPDILSTEEMQTMMDVTINLKHRTVIALMYACALRVSEAINVKINDIDSKNSKINIRNSKGKIDRIVMLDDSLLSLIREYWKVYRVSSYLFEGATGNHYSVTSIQNIVKSSAKKAGINKRISSHSLRHSCLTQLIKNGVDLRRVQKIAGHKNINTTANYIKIIDSDILETESPVKAIRL
jgi:site-specific recombinase XerD